MSALGNFLVYLLTNSIVCVISGSISTAFRLIMDYVFRFFVHPGLFTLTSDLVDVLAVVEAGF